MKLFEVTRRIEGQERIRGFFIMAERPVRAV